MPVRNILSLLLISACLIFAACSPTTDQALSPDAAQPTVQEAGSKAAVAMPDRYGAHAPKLSGQEDWYLERQLSNFMHGVRGSAEHDTHGKSMALMACVARILMTSTVNKWRRWLQFCLTNRQ